MMPDIKTKDGYKFIHRELSTTDHSYALKENVERSKYSMTL